MISLKDLKYKIEELEREVIKKGLNIEDVPLCVSHMDNTKIIEMYIYSDMYFGNFVNIDIS
jgi:hypothetical protein